MKVSNPRAWGQRSHHIHKHPILKEGLRNSWRVHYTSCSMVLKTGHSCLFKMCPFHRADKHHCFHLQHLIEQASNNLFTAQLQQLAGWRLWSKPAEAGKGAVLVCSSWRRRCIACGGMHVALSPFQLIPSLKTSIPYTFSED